MTGRGVRPSYFDTRASIYDQLRPAGEVWWERFDAVVRLGDLRGQRVLDVGCGTGAVAAALAEKAAAKVWGVEPSGEMLAVARGRVPKSVGLKQGSAEELPFRDGWFDRVVYSLVIHLLDRPRALAEAARVLVPHGRVVVATFAHEHFDRYWAGRFFPSLAAVDKARFPTEDELAGELAAGRLRRDPIRRAVRAGGGRPPRAAHLDVRSPRPGRGAARDRAGRAGGPLDSPATL